MFTKKTNLPIFAAILIVIIAFFLRLNNLTSVIGDIPPGLYPDEAMNGNNALEALSTNNFKIFYPENNGREGLFINIQALSVSVLGNKPWALRLPSAIFGVLTVMGLYFLVKKLFDSNKYASSIALLSSFFLATSFWHINFSRIGFRAIMAPFFLVWGLYFLLNAAAKARKNKESKTYFWHLSILGGIVFGLGFYSYIAYRITPALILVILIILGRHFYKQNLAKLFWRFVFYAGIAFLFTVLPLCIYFAQNPADFMGRTSQISIFNSPAPVRDFGMNIIKTSGMFNFSGDTNWRHNYSGKPELFWPVGILFLIGLFIAVKSLFKKSKISEISLVLLAWIVFTALPVVVSNEGVPHALRAIIMIPPVFILAGIGGMEAYSYFKKHFRNKHIYNQICVLFLILCFCEGYISYFSLWAEDPNTPGAFSRNYVEIGEDINALPKEMPKYVVVEAGGALVRGIPMPSQTVMFITDSFTPEKQKEKNIYYLLPNQVQNIPKGSSVFYIK
ncbi:MAG: glycosyltransferase family 39 protein [Candidatus Pacebacteria bacterium]|nr:glycosyltransferase family 39 protein [Candidatus Paceibacterota bacterium]